MAQFDVYANPDSATADLFPYFVDIQHPLHSTLDVRVVIPLTTDKVPFGRLTPQFEIAGARLTLSPADIAGIPASVLQHPIANLEAHRSEIIDAVDFLIQGF